MDEEARQPGLGRIVPGTLADMGEVKSLVVLGSPPVADVAGTMAVAAEHKVDVDMLQEGRDHRLAVQAVALKPAHNLQQEENRQ